MKRHNVCFFSRVSGFQYFDCRSSGEVSRAGTTHCSLLSVRGGSPRKATRKYWGHSLPFDQGRLFLLARLPDSVRYGERGLWNWRRSRRRWRRINFGNGRDRAVTRPCAESFFFLEIAALSQVRGKPIWKKKSNPITFLSTRLYEAGKTDPGPHPTMETENYDTQYFRAIGKGRGS